MPEVCMYKTLRNPFLFFFFAFAKTRRRTLCIRGHNLYTQTLTIKKYFFFSLLFSIEKMVSDSFDERFAAAKEAKTSLAKNRKKNSRSFEERETERGPWTKIPEPEKIYRALKRQWGNFVLFPEQKCFMYIDPWYTRQIQASSCFSTSRGISGFLVCMF